MTPFLLLTLVEWMGVIAVTLILGLSPAFRRRPVKFVYPGREAIVGLSLYLLALVILTILDLAVFQGPNAPRVPSPLPVESIPPNYTVDRLFQQIGLLLVLVFPFLVALVIRRQPWLSAGLSQRSVRTGLEMGLALGLITVFLTNRTSAILNGVSQPEILYLFGMLAVSLVDEFIFRGYLMLRLQSYLGDTWGWIAQAALFSLWHLPQKLILEKADLTGLAFSLAYLFVFGLLLGWIMRKSGNILAPAIYHAIHNWVLVL